jgi:hypothetical protein
MDTHETEHQEPPRASRYPRVFFDWDAISTEFDVTHVSELAETLSVIDRLHRILAVCAYADEAITIGSRFEAFALIERSFNFLVSALRLVRERAHHEAFVLLRTGLEAACVAFHICEDPSAFAAYSSPPSSGARYDPKRAISPTKKVVPRIGEVWGALSSAAVHPNVEIFGPRIRRSNHNEPPAATIEVVTFRRESHLDPVALSFVRLCSTMTLHIVVLIYFKDFNIVGAHGHSFSIDGQQFVLFPDTVSPIERSYQDFLNAAETATKRHA